MKKIAIIGAGNMGSSIARGLIAQGVFTAGEICLTAKHESTLERLRFEFPGIGVETNNVKAASEAEIVVLAVKPWIAESVLQEMHSAFSAKTSRILVSVAAGVSTESLRRATGNHLLPIFIAIPNTAVSVAQSMTFLAADGATNEQIQCIRALFSCLGKVFLVPEKMLSAGTAIASCGIAFAMRYVRAATEGGVELGLPADLARDAVLQTLKGASELLAVSGENPETEIDKVTTPGGLTIRGLNKMEECGFSASVIQGLKACR
jgi:pyrroline-5-carboxylate reductase